MRDKPYYEDDQVTLWHCKEREFLLEGGYYDLLLTDVPYNLSDEHKEGGLRTLDYGEWDRDFDVVEFLDRWIDGCRKSAYVWCHETQLSYVLEVLRGRAMLDRSLAWVKPNPTVINGQQLWLPGVENCGFGKRPRTEFHFHCHPGWWLEPPDLPRRHPNQKPLRILQEQIMASTSPGDLVFDPLAGSGATGVAAKSLGRRAVLVEKREEVCEGAAEWLSQEVLELPPAPLATKTGRGIRARADDPAQLEVLDSQDPGAATPPGTP